MTRKLLVVADLGRFKAYRLEDDRNFSNPRLELLEDWETNVTHHLRDEVTDQAGQFRRGTPNGHGAATLSDGDSHNLDLERRRRAVKTVARRISELLQAPDLQGCYLAADSQMNKALMAEMDGPTRARIEKNVLSNLTGLAPAAVAQHFAG